ncbi:hypothetical protein AGMMS50256_22270 [Betaproteobacteria bacterium]|nr:hypothetical protein AGMMS50256_22270 [Betaproteobacteria bacterium]
MKKQWIVIAALSLLGPLAVGEAFADRGHGGRGGHSYSGSRGGHSYSVSRGSQGYGNAVRGYGYNYGNRGYSYSGGRNHGRSYYYGGHGHRYNYGSAVAGIALGSLFLGSLYYPTTYYSPAYAYYPPVVIENQTPEIYVEQRVVSSPQEEYWYYCQSPSGYYPEIPECRSAWIKVPPRP